MTTQFKQDKLAVENAAQDAQNLAVYKSWLEKHPNVTDCIANERIFREYADWTDPLTEADFDFAYGNLGAVLATQRVPTLEEVKAELVDKICELMGTSPTMTANVSTFRTKAAFKSLTELTAVLEELTRKREISAMPHADRKQILVNARQYAGYPTLGRTVVPVGRVKAVLQDAAYLKALDPWDLKRLCRLYGTEQVNNRLAGKD